MPLLDLSFDRGPRISQVADFALVDDATPLGIDDTSGSTGSVNVTIAQQNMRPAVMKGLVGQVVTLLAATGSQTLGTVSQVSGDANAVGIDIDTIATRLAVRRTAKPFTGTLAAAVRYWAGLCAVPAAQVSVDASIGSQAVALVGFDDNVWLRIKQLCAAVGIEVVVQGNAIVVRPPRAVFVQTDRVSARNWTIDTTTLARTITVAYYDPAAVVAGDAIADFSRATGTPDPDDPDAGTLPNAPAHALPNGYKKISALTPTVTS